LPEVVIKQTNKKINKYINNLLSKLFVAWIVRACEFYRGFFIFTASITNNPNNKIARDINHYSLWYAKSDRDEAILG
jgi:hypothetical protein